MGAQVFEGTPVHSIDTEEYTTAGGAAARKITGVYVALMDRSVYFWCACVRAGAWVRFVL